MNERIKDLAVQAKFMAEESINKQISASDELKAFTEKFAESLIKEGAAVLARSDRYRGQAFADDLLMHFGIAPARHDWCIKKVEGTKDKFYVEHGEPPRHVLLTYGIING